MKRIDRHNPFGVTESRAKPATESQLRAIDKLLKARLPAEYRRFLLTINGGRRVDGWDLPKCDTDVDTFLGIRKDHYALQKQVARAAKSTDGSDDFPPDMLVIAYSLANEPFLMKYHGTDAGSIWYYKERLMPAALRRKRRKSDPPIDAGSAWRKIAPSFDAFVKLLRQEPERADRHMLRTMLERDNVKAFREYLDAIDPEHLDTPIADTGHTLLQLAAKSDSVRIVQLLLSKGARRIAGLGNVSHAKIVRLLLTHGYKPTQYDWTGAVVKGQPALVKAYLDEARTPSAKLPRDCKRAALYQLSLHPSRPRREIVRMLEKSFGKA